MLYSPSQEIHDRLRSELSCVFVDRSFNEPHLWLVAKLPINLIREIAAGAPVTLRAWAVQVDGAVILSFGITVTDDPKSAFTTFGSCRSDGEAEGLRNILANGAAPVQFFNETFLPVLYADFRFDAAITQTLLNVAPTTGLAEAEAFKLRERANDVVQTVLNGVADDRILASCELPVTFAETEKTLIQIPEVGEVHLIDTDEGGEMEILTLQAFASMFPYGAFVNPYVGEGKKQRELCDVLAVSRVRELENEGIFVIQNKAASASTKGLARETQKRVSAIEKDIFAAIKQLRGAVKNLKAGKTIYRGPNGADITIDPEIPEVVEVLEPWNLKERANQIGHAIVVISEMHHKIDWAKVLRAIYQLSLDTDYVCQVLDLQELSKLIAHAKHRPAMLEGLLLERRKRMVEQQRPDIRFRFIVDTAEAVTGP